MHRGLAALAAAVLVGSMAGCTDDQTRSASAEPSRSPTSEAPTREPTSAPASTEESALDGGSADSPAPVESTTNRLQWTRVPGPATATVTRSGPWTLSVAEGGSRATLEGPGGLKSYVADSSKRISDGLIDGEWAAIVFQDEQETQPATAEIVRLGGSGGDFTVDGSSKVPTTTGGTWALGDGTLVHATIGPGRSYCLATVDLEKQTSARTWCAQKRHGFNGARITPAGTSLMTFDDQQPSCRTVVEVYRGRRGPVRGGAGVPGLGGPAERRRSRVVGGAEADPDRGGPLLRARRRRVLRPRTRHLRDAGAGAPERRTSRRTRSATATPPGCCGGRPTARSRWSTRPAVAVRHSSPSRGAGATGSRSRPSRSPATSRSAHRSADRAIDRTNLTRPTLPSASYPAPVSAFTGFPDAALDFYDDLEVDNTKSFWEKHKPVYDEAVRRR